jgi:hypothetical protein
MKPRSGSASEFALSVLRKHADRELRASEIVAMADGAFKAPNVMQCLKLLYEAGLVVRNKDGGEVWWAISPEGLNGQSSDSDDNREPVTAAEAAERPKLVKRPTMSIKGRW